MSYRLRNTRDKDTEEQVFRDSAKREFDDRPTGSSSFDGEQKYFVKTKTVDGESYDAHRAQQMRFVKCVQGTQINVFERLRKTLKKRDLTKEERREYVDLCNLSDDMKEFLTSEEQDRMDELKSLQYSSPEEKEVQKKWRQLLRVEYVSNATGDQPNDHYPLGNPLRLPRTNPSTSTKLRVLRADAVSLAKKHRYDKVIMRTEHRKPVIICPSSHYKPGGNWEKGFDGCEELLYYRTSAHFTFEQSSDKFYPLRPGAVLHVPDTMIVRNGDEDNYSLMETRHIGMYHASLLLFGRGMYQERSPPPRENKEAFDKWSAEIQQEHLQALRRVFRVAAYAKYDTLVYIPAASLDGKLPPAIGVQLFRKALEECRRFKHVDIAIPKKRAPEIMRGTVTDNFRKWHEERSALVAHYRKTYDAYKSAIDGVTLR